MRTHSAVPIPLPVAAALGLALAVAVAACSRPVDGPPTATPPTNTTPGPTTTPSPTAAAAGTGTWRVLAQAPIGASYYAGVWTGFELIIHAAAGADTEEPVGSIDVAYSPATNTWRRLPSSPYPVMMIEGGYRVVWTGSELLAFGSRRR